MGQQLSTIAATPSSRVLQIYNELEKTRIEREIAMQQLLEHRRRVYQLAYEREKLKWSASGGGIMMVFCVLSWLHHKNLMHLLPIFPTVTYLGYEAHYCYGDKVALIDKAASQIRAENLEVLVPATISVEDVRKRMEELRQIKQDEKYLVE